MIISSSARISAIEHLVFIVKTPLVGGAYGGKAAVQLEVIAYLASKAVGGRPVKLFNTREEDMITSPVHVGLDAIVKLGATKDGILQYESHRIWSIAYGPVQSTTAARLMSTPLSEYAPPSNKS